MFRVLISTVCADLNLNAFPSTLMGHGALHLNLRMATHCALILSNITEKVNVMEYSAKRNPKRCPSHPGALLREVIVPATGRSKVEIASLLGISRQHLHDIMREAKPVSPVVAVRLGKLFGNGASPWLTMQGAYDTWHAERSVDLAAIPTIKVA